MRYQVYTRRPGESPEDAVRARRLFATAAGPDDAHAKAEYIASRGGIAIIWDGARSVYESGSVQTQLDISGTAAPALF